MSKPIIRCITGCGRVAADADLQPLCNHHLKAFRGSWQLGYFFTGAILPIVKSPQTEWAKSRMFNLGGYGI